MVASSDSAPFVRAGLVAVLVVLVWRATVKTAPMPPVWPLGPQPVYSSVDAPALIALEPVLHAAWLGTPPAPVVGIAAVLVVLGASGVALFSGASTLAALLVLTALVLDSAFSAALAHAAGLALSVGFVWLAAGAAFDDRSRFVAARRWLHPLSALILWSVAVWCDWIAVLAWPIVLAAIRRTPDRPVRGWWTGGSLVIGAIVFVSHFAWMAQEARVVTAGDAALGWRDALLVAFAARPRMPLGSYAAPELTTRLGYLLMVLAVTGLLFGSQVRWWRTTVLMTAALAAALGVIWSEWQAEIVRFTLWSVAPFAAVGLTWIGSQGRRPVLITAVLGSIAIGETVALGARPLDGAEARRFRDLLAAALTARARASPILVVAEDTRIDSAVVSWVAGQTPRTQRVEQDGGLVRRAREDGRAVLAGPIGRRHLELLGVSFREAFSFAEPAAFAVAEADGMLQCAVVRGDRWSQLPGLEYTGRLGVRVPAGMGGELQMIIGDALVLPVRAETADGRDMVLRQETLSSGPGVSPPPADYWIDEGAPVESRWVHRVRFAADPLVPSLLSLELGRRAPRTIARLFGYGEEARGRICAANLGAVHLGASGSETLDLGDETLFGAGWYGLEGRGADAFRWADANAVVLVRSAVRADVEIALETSAAIAVAGDGPPSIVLKVNGVDVGGRALRPGSGRYTWRVPAGTWVAGTNELLWTSPRAVRPADTGGRDTRSLAIRVTGISLTR
jgi:hypothetical protein